MAITKIVSPKGLTVTVKLDEGAGEDIFSISVEHNEVCKKDFISVKEDDADKKDLHDDADVVGLLEISTEDCEIISFNFSPYSLQNQIRLV